ncbi:MutS-related protein [Prevotella bivia]|uniref:MutS-related protein n=1 Tax=Prevotella bivia TaxID=28125 RepID=UPI000661195E|nr:DNA mismatch repair protein MutS [Prevotella bivia]
MNTELYTYYKNRIAEVNNIMIHLKGKNTYFVLGEVITFAGIIGFMVFYVINQSSFWVLLSSLLSLILYMLIRNFDAKNTKQIEALTALLNVYKREVRYHEGYFDQFAAGEQFVDARHSFTFDLDIFGQLSLYQRINRCVTTGGADYLALCLSEENLEHSQKAKLAQIGRRSESIRTLAQDRKLVTQFKALGVEKIIDTVAIQQALAKVETIRVPHFFGTQWFKILLNTGLVGFYVSLVLAVLGYCDYSIPSIWAAANFNISFFASYRYLKKITVAFDRVRHQIQNYVRVMQLIETINAGSSEELQQIKSRLANALAAFEYLERISQKIDGRSNEFGVILFNVLRLIDLSIISSFVSLQNHFKASTRQWLDAVSKFDALVSMANFRLNEDKATEARVVESNEVVFEAEGLYHPFLGDKAVTNNFSVENLHYYIITGANMAGKSTFLRTLGINYVLAMNGLPVFATRFTISIFHLFTSMRTTDDLANGISYFNAELLRLKQLIGSLQPTMPNLIILDEILKGTNSLDKLNGSRLFLEYVSERNVTGVIATHDLELSKMDANSRFHNFCFEIELGSNIGYSYKLGVGVARNQNATYLLKDILAD